jgi:hypothetical protein
MLNKLCSPALFYLILSIISFVAAAIHKVKMSSMIVKAIFILLWTWFLNWLCTNGHKDIAWFLVILPFVIMLGMFVIAMEIITRH